MIYLVAELNISFLKTILTLKRTETPVIGALSITFICLI